MKTKLKKTAFLARPGPAFMGGALLAMLVAVSPVHAGWLVEDQKLTASDAAAGDAFGDSIAVSGDTAVVGAYGDDDQGEDSGSVYIFVRSGNTWVEQAKLNASDAAANDNFGQSVSIVDDTIVVGSRQGWDGSGIQPGAAYVFVRNGTVWSEEAKLHTTGETTSFGREVAVSGDTVVVGGRDTDNTDGTYSGAIYVFNRINGSWTQQAQLTAPEELDDFGSYIAISGDTVVAGQELALNEKGETIGAAFVFVRSGNTWSNQAKLMPSDLAEENYFGTSVAISGDTVVVGAHSADSAYVFVRDGNTWSEQAKLTPSDPVFYAWEVAVSQNTVIVEAYIESGEQNAYVFVRNGDTWSQQARLKISDFDKSNSSIAISNTIAMLGGDRSSGPGAAYAFDLGCDATYSLPSNHWQQVSLPCDPGVNNTVTAVFGDDIPGTYGRDWFVYRYNANRYVKLSATDTLSQGEIYGVFQWSGSDVTLDMPGNSTPTPVTDPAGCLDTAKGCFEIPLVTQVNSAQSSLVGYPFATSGRLGDVRVQTDTGVCTSGCDLDTAQSQGIVLNKLSGTEADSSGNLEPWKGYWATTLHNADGLNPRLLVPKP
ncbi:MAG: hypothetical protein DSZ28_04155 [Thiothrix sp.]|nr:MAG: hypothetical protein DSZ28_04155 [Thiothrix sp.]